MTGKRWALLGTSAFLLIVVLIVGGTQLWMISTTNPKVIAELRQNPSGQRAKSVMVLTFNHGKVLPVNYLREGERVFVGADGPGWRRFREPTAVALEIRGQRLRGVGRVVLDDADYTREVFKRLRPTVPTWLPTWLNAYLIVIDLEPV